MMSLEGKNGQNVNFRAHIVSSIYNSKIVFQVQFYPKPKYRFSAMFCKTEKPVFLYCLSENG